MALRHSVRTETYLPVGESSRGVLDPGVAARNHVWSRWILNPIHGARKQSHVSAEGSGILGPHQGRGSRLSLAQALDKVGVPLQWNVFQLEEAVNALEIGPWVKRRQCANSVSGSRMWEVGCGQSWSGSVLVGILLQPDELENQLVWGVCLCV